MPIKGVHRPDVRYLLAVLLLDESLVVLLRLGNFANQITDGLTPGNPVTLNVYQLSATVGRGYALNGTV